MRKANRILIVLILEICTATAFAGDNWLNLAGNWRFALDPNNAGMTEKWLDKSLDDTIKLPGTTDENQKGAINNNKNETTHLTRLYPFVGYAWYQCDIDIKPEWANKRIVLFLERTRNSRLWVDDNEIGSQNSLVAIHALRFSTLCPLTTGRSSRS